MRIKNILCYGDSHVWGFIPGSFDTKTLRPTRYTYQERWTQQLQIRLGETFNIIEDGLNGRTIDQDEVGRPYRNAMSLLPLALESHTPLDGILFLLGINDTKVYFNKSPEQIQNSMKELIILTKTTLKFTQGNPCPPILLLSPPPLTKKVSFTELFDQNSKEKSLELSLLYQDLAKEEGCFFLDLKNILEVDESDGIHFSNKYFPSLVDSLYKTIQSFYR